MNRLMRLAHDRKALFYFSAVLILIFILADPAPATHLVRTAGCSGEKGCHAIIRLPDGHLEAIDLEGFGVGLYSWM